MPSFRIVEAVDVVEHIGLGLVPRSVDFTRRALGLERGEEALHRRIVADVARTTHRADHIVIRYQPLKLFAALLVAAIRMMQQRIEFGTSPDRHHQSNGDQLGRHYSTHRPADHAAGEQIDDRLRNR